jgi:glutamate N-acetyltransferase/amino-acid N-acetyltransferase
LSARPLTPGVTAPRGFRAGSARAGIKPGARRDDVALVVSDEPAVVAAVFTTNRVQAAPVTWSRRVVGKHGRARAVLLNSGNANACTGAAGDAAVRRSAAVVAELLECDDDAVLVASTGVIGVPFPVERLLAALPRLACTVGATPAGGRRAADAIMTTDTRRKQAAVRVRTGGRDYTVGGMAKGAGMIHPEMATLLSVITTDAPLGRAQARTLLRAAVDATFNTLTVDGDTSTNDCVFLLANGAAGGTIARASRAEAAIAAALQQVCAQLAEAIAADGEGAKKVLVVHVAGARSAHDARTVARTIAASNLVKTAVHGGDPNWGRVLAAAGRAGVRLDPQALDLRIGGHLVAQNGAAHPAGEAAAARHLRGKRVEMTLRIGAGPGEGTALGSDLSADYVRINAHYRS